MTELPFYQVDAFVTDRPLTGNPAAVMPLESWLDAQTMQAIAAENNLSETAFLVRSDSDDSDWDLRWFTPTTEVDLCGHATIASARVLIGDGPALRFATRSGVLRVEQYDDRLWLDLPQTIVNEAPDPDLLDMLGLPADTPLFIGEGNNGAAIVLLADEAAVRAVKPDFARLRDVPPMVIVTAPGDSTAIASRVFAPFYGINEDPVTGSAHSALVPFWAQRLGRDRFDALQASRRGGHLDCERRGERVILGGHCNIVIEGTFRL